ncbi:MAG TPA: hypothetical protein VFZ66_29565 [Herpetosiphonaceae bacterium]
MITQQGATLETTDRIATCIEGVSSTAVVTGLHLEANNVVVVSFHDPQAEQDGEQRVMWTQRTKERAPTVSTEGAAWAAEVPHGRD